MESASDTLPLLQVKNLKTFFFTPEGDGKAVNGVSLSLDRKETLGIVGESGCGKSVTALSILRLVPDPPGKIVSGQVLFEGRDLLTLSERDMRQIRGKDISMIFQDPLSSLDPVFTIGDQMGEVFRLHRGSSRKEAAARSIEMLKLVRIPSPEKRISEYPYQMSGGMRQRVMIAMALACGPKILVADEPTTALDMTIQAQILDLMLRLKEDFETAILLISHDLAMISEAAQRLIIMYTGEVVEEAPTREIFEHPLHPYTRGLLQSTPHGAVKGRRLQEIPGTVPSLFKVPQGCLFHPRCPQAMPVCREKSPEWTRTTNRSSVRCWLYAS
jgi:peptide/nickel transport system ATP-binding protein/oligopeptide transport system ATP-binding protein